MDKEQKGFYYPALDGLRAFAILWVMGYHSLGPIGTYLGHGGGWAGVDVFFVISGFLITSILLREQSTTGDVSYGKFYARRILRLVPAYYVFLFGMLVWNPLHFPKMLNAIGICLVYLSNYDLIFNWGNVAGSGAEITWSLSVEEQFYF
ncbi:MAG TPA: acyltransferase, partial [Chroococcales cyanobacterium]